MTPQEIIAIMQLMAALTPIAQELANNIIKSFQSSDMTVQERQAMINDLAAALKPMQEKV